MKRFMEFLEEQTKSKSLDYVNDFFKSTHPHPFSDRERIVNGNATMHISTSGKDGIHIHDIRSLKPKSGAGTAALKHAKSLADKHGVSLNLHAKTYHNDKQYISSNKRLKSWYEKHGFKSHGGSEHEGYRMSYSPGKK
jgi:hypothetical protein